MKRKRAEGGLYSWMELIPRCASGDFNTQTATFLIGISSMDLSGELPGIEYLAIPVSFRILLAIYLLMLYIYISSDKRLVGKLHFIYHCTIFSNNINNTPESNGHQYLYTSHTYPPTPDWFEFIQPDSIGGGIDVTEFFLLVKLHPPWNISATPFTTFFINPQYLVSSSLCSMNAINSYLFSWSQCLKPTWIRGWQYFIIDEWVDYDAGG